MADLSPIEIDFVSESSRFFGFSFIRGFGVDNEGGVDFILIITIYHKCLNANVMHKLI